MLLVLHQLVLYIFYSRVTVPTVAVCMAKNAIGGLLAFFFTRCSSAIHLFTPTRSSEPTAKSWTTKIISGWSRINLASQFSILCSFVDLNTDHFCLLSSEGCQNYVILSNHF